jgi:hypothetical protein
MNLVSALFDIARNISDGDNEELNRLNEKANNQVSKYHTKSTNKLHALYAKAHQGWFFQLALIFAIPFISVWIISKKNKLMNNDHDIYDDNDREHYDSLRGQYEDDDDEDYIY